MAELKYKRILLKVSGEALGEKSPLGDGFGPRLVFPDQEGSVAVGQAVETMVGNGLVVTMGVFPNHVAVPVIFTEGAVPAAELFAADKIMPGFQMKGDFAGKIAGEK